MDNPQRRQNTSTSKVLVVIIVVGSLLAGGLLGYFVGYSATSEEIDNLQGQITELQEQISTITTTLEETFLYSQLYEQVENLQSQVTALQEQVLSLESSQDITGEVDKLQNQLSTLQEQIDTLQTEPTVTYQNITYLLDEIDDLEDQLSTLQQQINNLQMTPTVTHQNITYIIGENFSLSQLFDQVRQSVVVVEGLIPQYDRFGRLYYTQVQGSGFVYSINGQMVILTSYHIVADTTTINVTFVNGNEYEASILGSDQYADLAVLSTSASQSEYKPLEIISSSTLKVGDLVIVIGTPYGLEGSMSEGLVSALNRTLVAEEYSITGVIQTTAPLNPGNSGGPLLNYQGQVVGIATAIVQESQGIGFAIPSDVILENIEEII
jgi:S1-C subfamily serine protease